MRYIDVTGKTEAEAIEKALAQLGLERDDVSVEILERAKSGFLGIGSSPAKVRVTYDDGPEAEEAPAPAAEKAVQAPEKIPQVVEKPKAEPKRAEKKAKAECGLLPAQRCSVIRLLHCALCKGRQRIFRAKRLWLKSQGKACRRMAGNEASRKQ